MFEEGFDQAHGLTAWELTPPTRVLPVVASGDSSLALLWTLEQGFQRLGHDVVVVDGLNGVLPRDALLGSSAVLRRWLHGVPAGCVTLLHAPLEATATLLCDSMARPLVALTADKSSVVQAYQAVKVLAEVSGLQAIVLQADERDAALQTRAGASLRQTCSRCLNMVPSVWGLEYDGHPSGRDLRLQHDATLLKVLDSALMIEDAGTRKHVDPSFERQPYTADQTIGASDVYRQRYA